MSYFKAPVNKYDDRDFQQWYVALVNIGLDRLYSDACTGFCLYEFFEGKQKVRVLSSTMDMQGCVKMYNPEVSDEDNNC